MTDPNLAAKLQKLAGHLEDVMIVARGMSQAVGPDAMPRVDALEARLLEILREYENREKLIGAARLYARCLAGAPFYGR